MAATVILDPSSLAETLWNLEEARWAGVPADASNVKAALDWVAARQGQPGAYAGVLFAPSSGDFAFRRSIPTGEDRAVGRGGMMHILGEEAARALVLWGRADGWDRPKVMDAIAGMFPRDRAPSYAGRFCCFRCSVARWRALTAGRPDHWEDALCDGLRALAADDRIGAGRWKRFPFYYTLLALAEIPMEEAQAERKRLYPAAERALLRLVGDDRVARFRRHAVEWVLAD